MRREGDFKLGTGFLSPEEVKAVFKALPVEVTFADDDDVVQFYLRGVTPYSLERKLYWKAPAFLPSLRLEKLVIETVDALKKGEADYKVFWTRISDRLVRVFISAVRG
ncbi:MAG: hypothetical protein QXY49_03055 [Thermofilaceae archaeon]